MAWSGSLDEETSEKNKVSIESSSQTAGKTGVLARASEPIDLAARRRTKQDAELLAYGGTGEIGLAAIGGSTTSESFFDSKPQQKRSLPSNEFVEIIRSHFAKPIFNALEMLQSEAGTPGAAVYINTILHKTREMDEESPADPFLRILFTFYDALAFNNNWTRYSSAQFRLAKGHLEQYSKLAAIKSKDVEKAIIGLKNIGFDTMPFTLDENGLD